MKLFLFLFLWIVTPAFCSELDTLWNQALQSSNPESIPLWESWIEKAEEQQIKSPEAYYNLACSFWREKDVANAVINLLISAQLRKGFFEALGDLNLLMKIQSALADFPSPIHSLPLKLFFLFSDQTKKLGLIALGWMIILAFFLRFGFNPAKNKSSLTLLALALLVLIAGFAANQTQKNIAFPCILNNQKELVPVYGSLETKDEKPILELPSGLLVLPQTEKGEWVRIEQPTSGWIKREMLIPFPQQILDSSDSHGA